MKVKDLKPYLKDLNLTDKEKDEICQKMLENPISTSLLLSEIVFEKSKQKLELIPLVNCIEVISETGKSFIIKNNSSNNISILVRKTDINHISKNNKLLSDEWIDVYLIKTENPIQPQSFLTIEKLNEFLTQLEVKFIKYTVSTKHNLVDENGINYSIMDIINNNNSFGVLVKSI